METLGGGWGTTRRKNFGSRSLKVKDKSKTVKANGGQWGKI
jgi:hypothetical protein